MNLPQELSCPLQHPDEALTLSLSNYLRSKINRSGNRANNPDLYAYHASEQAVDSVDSSGEEPGAPHSQTLCNLAQIMQKACDRARAVAQSKENST